MTAQDKKSIFVIDMINQLTKRISQKLDSLNKDLSETITLVNPKAEVGIGEKILQVQSGLAAVTRGMISVSIITDDFLKDCNVSENVREQIKKQLEDVFTPVMDFSPEDFSKESPIAAPATQTQESNAGGGGAIFADRLDQYRLGDFFEEFRYPTDSLLNFINSNIIGPVFVELSKNAKFNPYVAFVNNLFSISEKKAGVVYVGTYNPNQSIIEPEIKQGLFGREEHEDGERSYTDLVIDTDRFIIHVKFRDSPNTVNVLAKYTKSFMDKKHTSWYNASALPDSVKSAIFEDLHAKMNPNRLIK